MAMDANGKAYATSSPVQWSPADGGFVQHCPTNAIIARTIGATQPAYETTQNPEPAQTPLDAAGD
jgi:hypothetical protein